MYLALKRKANRCLFPHLSLLRTHYNSKSFYPANRLVCCLQLLNGIMMYLAALFGTTMNAQAFTRRKGCKLCDLPVYYQSTSTSQLVVWRRNGHGSHPESNPTQRPNHWGNKATVNMRDTTEYEGHEIVLHWPEPWSSGPSAKAKNTARQYIMGSSPAPDDFCCIFLPVSCLSVS